MTFRLIIHTVQMLAVASLGGMDSKNLNKNDFVIRPRARFTAKGCLIPLNLNKFVGSNIGCLKSFFVALMDVQGDLGIYDDWQFDRIDFAFDTTLKFDDIYKLCCLFIYLVSNEKRIKNTFSTQDLRTKKKRALTCKGRNFEFQIYNKRLESGGKHPFCRFEFRFKNLSTTDIYSVINDLQLLLNVIPDRLKAVEKERVEDLYRLGNRKATSKIKMGLKISVNLFANIKTMFLQGTLQVLCTKKFLVTIALANG